MEAPRFSNYKISKLQNYKISRLVLPYYENGPPVDNPSYLP